MKNSIGFIMRTESKFSLAITSSHKREKFVFVARPSQIHIRWIFLLLPLLTLAIGGCASHQSSDSTPTSIATNTPTATSLPIYTPTLPQTATLVFTSTPTATPILPVLNETPYPQPHETISADNVSRIRQLALLSTGLGPRDIELSANQSLLAIASSAGVYLYDPKTLYRLAFFAANSDYGSVQSVALSPDGKLMATGDESGTIEVWEVEKHQLIYNFVDGHKEGVQSLAFSPDSRKLVTGGRDARTKVWDLETGGLISSTQHGGDVYQVKFSADGQWVFTASEDTIKMTEVETGKIVNTFFDTDPVRAMTLSDDGQLLASGNSIWDISSGVRLLSLRFGSVSDLDFSKSGKQLAIGTYEQIIIVDTQSGKELHRFDSATDSLTFLPDNNLLLSGYSFDSTVKIWNLDNEKLLQVWNLGERGVLKVAFSPDGTKVAAGLLYDVTAKLWDTYNGQLLHTLSENYHGSNCDGVRDLAFSPDGTRLITAARCNFSIVREWDVESGKPLQILDDGGGDHVAFSSDERFIAWCAYKKVVLWDVINQRELRTWNPKPNGRFYDIEFSPDSNLLAVFSHESNSLQLWKVESGKSIVTLGDYAYGIWSAAFSPNGRLLAVGTRNRAQIWEIESGKSMQILSLPDKYEYVLDMAFSPSGDILATIGGVFPGTNPHTKSWQIRFWQVESGQLLHTQPVGIYGSSLAFSPNGRMLLTGNLEDGTVRLWGILP